VIRVIFFIFVLILADMAFAIPSRAGRGTASSARRSSYAARSARPAANVVGKGGYQALTGHEAAAEKQARANAEYQETLRAIKEGRYVPPVDPRQASRSSSNARLEEIKMQRAEAHEQKRLERLEQKRIRDEKIEKKKSRMKQKVEKDAEDRDPATKAVEEAAKPPVEEVSEF